MPIRVVTNNPRVPALMDACGFTAVFMEGSAKSALLGARDMVVAGWRLAADPLAGYKRFNPYHTVFLTDGANGGAAADILRLERAALHMQSPNRPTAENTESINADYGILDASIAACTAKRLKLYE